MTLWQRTAIRVGVASIFVALVLYRAAQYPMPLRVKLLFGGATFVALGVLAFVIRRPLDRAAPNLKEQLVPMWGYGLPKWAETPFMLLIVFVGLAMIIWAELMLKNSN
jgi:hypothetical protein